MKFRPRVPSGRVALEPLEQRRVLSAIFAPGPPAFDPFADGPPVFDPGSPGPVAPGGASLQDLISVSPSDGAVVSGSDAPTAITVQLSNGLTQSWTDKTTALYRLGDDGTATPIFGDGNWPDIIADPAANTVTMPLDGPLGPGRYRLVLLGGFGSFSHMISNGAWDYMEDQTLAEFQVAGRANPFDDAIDAGTAGVDARTFPGALGAAGEQAYYKIQLGAERALWRLGLQLDAQRIGSDLLATLTVYDARGNALATKAGRLGLASAPDDPYLFVGLEPGTYYVAVSATAAAGDYRLTIAADPVAGPTRVVGFALDWSRGAPVGFTITFSDAIAPDQLATAAAPLWVVDAGGTIHAATLSAAADGLRRLSFVFDQPIAPGDYSLIAPEGGGLVDLIGRAPAADGLPPGLLANWTVAPYQASGGPETGTGWLDNAHRESLIDNAVGAGGALSLRFGVGVGPTTTTPSAPNHDSGTIPGVPAAAAPSASLIGALDSSLFGRPAARNDGTTPNPGAITPEGRALLAGVARERLAAGPNSADDGLVRSPDGEPEIARAGLWPTSAPRPEPRLVAFRGGETSDNDDGVRADVDALERIENNRLVDASANVLQWLFGAPTHPGTDADAEAVPTDAQLLARIDADAAERSRDGRADDGKASRAGLGVPTGVIVLAAVAYRLHRRPPRWWRRRRPTIDASGAPPRAPIVPRGPRFMTPKPAGRPEQPAGRGRH